MQAGLGDYYRHRSDTALSAAKTQIPGFLSRVELYDRPEIQQAFVRGTGQVAEATLLLENIRCAACLWLNERHLRGLPGVIEVHIDDVTRRARVRWNPERIRLSEILTAIADIGYIAHPYDATRSEQIDRLRRRRSTEKLIFAGGVGMLVMNFSLAGYVMGEVDASGQLPLWLVIGRWTSLVLTLLIMLYSGQEFLLGAWTDLRNHRLGMDVPIVLGLLTAWAGSLHATLTGHGDVYYDSIAMFVFFLLLARRYELGSRIKAADTIDRLARVAPRTAQRFDAAGGLREVVVEDLRPGDRIRLKPGETLPVDGLVAMGTSCFDESLMTGEPAPVLKHPGDEVISGSVNGDQAVVVEVVRPVQSSALNEVQRLVETGLEQRPRYALLAERIATPFVAVILLIAVLTAGYWLFAGDRQWLAHVVAVLIVTCPCALALATPVALTGFTGRLVRRGILPLRVSALDALATSRRFVFDKTGTLTEGRPRLVEVECLSGIDRQAAIDLAACLNVHSEHPVAGALRAASHEGSYKVVEVRNVPGSGIEATVEGRPWRFGRPDYAVGGEVPDRALLERIEYHRQQGRTVSLLAEDGIPRAILVFEDKLRPGMARLLEGLRGAGVSRFSILSGDATSLVQGLGRRLGIPDCHGGMSPAEKREWIKHRQRQGDRIVMFGDGINDAPALAQADASLSFATATDLANANSDFLILGDDIVVVGFARRMARRTRRNIMQNFAWAIGYNLVAVPFAAMGMIPPWGAAVGMSLSSLLVVANALRLRKVKV